MRIASEVSARRIANADPTECEILVDGRPTGSIVSGAVLEAAVETDGFRLLFMTDDVPHEDALSIHLFDAEWRLIDSAVLGAAYSTGTFAALRLEPPRRTRFRFIGDTDWTVDMLPRPQWRLPFFAEAPGVQRDFGFRRHFVVRGSPRPATD